MMPPRTLSTWRIRFRGAEVLASDGELLRTALLRANLTPHNGRAKMINCRGLGSCGTCAVAIAGEVAPPAWTGMEALRLRLPPHRAAGGSPPRLRLACQVTVHGDLWVTKHAGFWGQARDARSTEPAHPPVVAPFGELEYVFDRRNRTQK